MTTYLNSNHMNESSHFINEPTLERFHVMKNQVVAIALSLLPILTSCSRAEKPASGNVAISQQAMDQSHAAFSAVLKVYLKNDKVDYAGLKKYPQALTAYLDTLAAVPESDFKKWNKNQQMAFLINLYNATTLKLIIDHYPLKSIKDIGSVLKGPWKQEVVRLFGKNETLDYVENDLLREKYKDPRIHFGVNCASIGCPSLRAEAFQGAKLDAQLDEQASAFLRDLSKNHLDKVNKTINLSSIFEWFKGDFTAKSGTVEKFIAPYLSDEDRKVIEKEKFSIRYNDYSWNLNKQ